MISSRSNRAFCGTVLIPLAGKSPNGGYESRVLLAMNVSLTFPRSISKTVTDGLALSRFANTHPAVPPNR